MTKFIEVTSSINVNSEPGRILAPGERPKIETIRRKTIVNLDHVEGVVVNSDDKTVLLYGDDELPIEESYEDIRDLLCQL